MKKAALALVVAATLGVVASAVAVAGPARGGVTHVVEMRAMVFSPAALEITAGDTVVWVNHDLVPHTATDTAGVWDTGRIEGGGRGAWAASKAGDVAYVCAYHPSMRGTIRVGGAR